MKLDAINKNLSETLEQVNEVILEKEEITERGSIDNAIKYADWALDSLKKIRKSLDIKDIRTARLYLVELQRSNLIGLGKHLELLADEVGLPSFEE